MHPMNLNEANDKWDDAMEEANTQLQDEQKKGIFCLYLRPQQQQQTAHADEIMIHEKQ